MAEMIKAANTFIYNKILNVYFPGISWPIFMWFHIGSTVNWYKWFCTIEQDGCHARVFEKKKTHAKKNLFIKNKERFEAASLCIASGTQGLARLLKWLS